MRAVLDTNVLISGLIWRGNAYQCVQAAEAGLYEFVAAGDHHLLQLRSLQGIDVLSPRQFLDRLATTTE